MKLNKDTLTQILLSILLIANIIDASPAHHRHVKRDLPKLVTTTSYTANKPAVTTTDSSKSDSDSASDSDSNPDTTLVASNTTSYLTSSTLNTQYISNPVTIPSDEHITNPHIYRESSTNGTVFIAFGSCLGFILLALMSVWLAFTVKAWFSARREYQLKEMENKFQIDPFNGNSGFVSSNFDTVSYDSASSESNYHSHEKNSDISEKVLKTKSSRLSLYSLGSNSALNLLNNFDNSNPSSSNNNKNLGLNNSRMSMFISPTEILQNETNQWLNNSNMSSERRFTSVDSTPNAQTSAVSNSQFITNDYNELNWNYPNNGHNVEKKNFRPPSTHLDNLLNQDDKE